MKIASIDIGTNSSRLLIAEYENKSYREIKRDLITTRLGKGVDQTGTLSYEAINRVVTAVMRFDRDIKKYNVEKINFVGTSALRDVDNSDELINLILQKTSLKLKVISGEEEAKLIYKGVSIDLPFNNFLIIDIGGGSTEFIWKNNNNLKFKSLDIGAVRMTERYIKNPVSGLNYKIYRNMTEDIYKLLEHNLQLDIKKLPTVGVGGTITTLAAIDQKMEYYNSDKIHHYQLPGATVRKLLKNIFYMNLEQRKRLKGLNEKRADIILAGMVIVHALQNFIQFDKITLSEHDILYGLITDMCS